MKTCFSRSILVGFLLGTVLFAQMTITGSISGTIVDPSGKSVPGAKVTLVSEKTRKFGTPRATSPGRSVSWPCNPTPIRSR